MSLWLCIARGGLASFAPAPPLLTTYMPQISYVADMRRPRVLIYSGSALTLIEVSCRDITKISLSDPP